MVLSVQQDTGNEYYKCISNLLDFKKYFWMWSYNDSTESNYQYKVKRIRIARPFI
jgi:hypothetical protein